MPVQQTITIDNAASVTITAVTVTLVEGSNNKIINATTTPGDEVYYTPTQIVIDSNFGTSNGITGTIKIDYSKNTNSCSKTIAIAPEYAVCLDSELDTIVEGDEHYAIFVDSANVDQRGIAIDNIEHCLIFVD